MEQMKRSIIEGTEAVEAEKKKNVELLHMIFPEKLASRLWRGIDLFYNIKFNAFKKGSNLTGVGIIIKCGDCKIKIKFINQEYKCYITIPRWNVAEWIVSFTTNGTLKQPKIDGWLNVL